MFFGSSISLKLTSPAVTTQYVIAKTYFPEPMTSFSVFYQLYIN